MPNNNTEIEFVMPDRKTFVLETFRRVNSINDVSPGQQYISDIIKDVNNKKHILLTCKRTDYTHIISKGMGGHAYDTCWIFCDPETRY